LLLIFAVLGSIFSGIAPPSQAAAIGAAGAVLLAGLRLADEAGSKLKPVVIAGFVATVFLVALPNMLNVGFGPSNSSLANALAFIASVVFLVSIIAGGAVLNKAGELSPALKSATQITSMVFVIIIGANLFSHVFGGFRGDELVEGLLESAPGGPTGALIITMLVMFLLGFFLDFIEIIYIIVPLVAPVLISAGFDPVWLGV